MTGWIAGECLVLDSFMWPHALWGGMGVVQLLLVLVLLGVLRPEGAEVVEPTRDEGAGRVETSCGCPGWDVHFVAKVVDRNGNTVYEAKKEGTQAIEENVAANVTDALTSVVEEGTGTKASQLKRPVAGKTGTNGVDDSITSAWFVGYTRQISTAVMYVAGDSGNENLDAYKKPGDKTFP